MPYWKPKNNQTETIAAVATNTEGCLDLNKDCAACQPGSLRHCYEAWGTLEAMENMKYYYRWDFVFKSGNHESTMNFRCMKRRYFQCWLCTEFRQGKNIRSRKLWKLGNCGQLLYLLRDLHTKKTSTWFKLHKSSFSNKKLLQIILELKVLLCFFLTFQKLQASRHSPDV